MPLDTPVGQLIYSADIGDGAAATELFAVLYRELHAIAERQLHRNVQFATRGGNGSATWTRLGTATEVRICGGTPRLTSSPAGRPDRSRLRPPDMEVPMSRSRIRLAILALAAALSPAAPAAAQKVSISPTIGVYIPTSELVKAANGDEFKQEVGLAVGGRINVNVSPRFGILTSVTYVPSDLKLNLATGEQVKDNANLLFGSARATFYVLPITAPVWFALNGGASYIRRSGDAFEDASDKDDIGGVVGATVGFRLGNMLSFYVAADDYIYGTRIDEATLETDKKTQNDVHLQVGFGVPLNR